MSRMPIMPMASEMQSDSGYLTAVLWLLSFIVQTFPFIFYTSLWTYPGAWARLCGSHDPCKTMGDVAHMFKALQLVGFLSVANWDFPPWFCFVLLAGGQFLNAKVYQLIGSTGVYYGVRFGKHVPWISAFPYSVMRDPQYIGCMLTTVAIMWNTPTVHCVFLLIGYVYLMWLESEERTPRYINKLR
ncbi:hypothetical protein AAMO2058_000107800 [Amorphochlora amoebiformis]